MREGVQIEVTLKTKFLSTVALGQQFFRMPFIATSPSQNFSEGLCKKFILGFNHILNPTLITKLVPSKILSVLNSNTVYLLSRILCNPCHLLLVIDT